VGPNDRRATPRAARIAALATWSGHGDRLLASPPGSGYPGRVWIRVLVVIAIVLPAGVAAADGEPLAAYERRGAAWQCPEGRVLAEALQAHLGDDADRIAHRAAVTMAGEGGELWAEARLLDGDRVVAVRFIVARSGDCAELIEAVALALAIALVPRESPPEPAEPVGEVAPTPAPIAVNRVAAPPMPPPPPPALRYAAGLGLAAGLGTAPGLSTGMTLEGRARRADLSLGIEYRHDRESLEPVASGAIGMQLRVASLVPCAHRGRLAACAVASAGALHGQGHDLDGARTDATPYFAYGARVAVSQSVGDRLSLRLAADLVGISTGTTVRVGDMEIWSTAPAAASVGLAAIADFP
jgi:hypothetical protein